MNVGIVTGYRIVNYGSVLQAYATQQVVNSLGYNSKLIRFENNKKDSFAYLSLLRNLCSFYHWGLRIEKIKLRKIEQLPLQRKEEISLIILLESIYWKHYHLVVVKNC